MREDNLPKNKANGVQAKEGYKKTESNKLEWCCNKKNGITLIEPNDNLSDEYMKESDKTLDSLDLINDKWGLIMGYYACYNALYSLMMKMGIKSEIHDCSIELMKMIPQFSDDDINFIKNLKKDRIDAQYYLKDKVLDDKGKEKEFVLKCKQIKGELDTPSIREKLRRIIKGDKN